MIDERKNVQTTPPAPTASAVGIALLLSKLEGRPRNESYPASSHSRPPQNSMFCKFDLLSFSIIRQPYECIYIEVCIVCECVFV